MATPSTELSIDGAPYQVSRLRGRLRLSELFRFDVSAWSRDADAKPSALIGSPFELVQRDAFGATQTWTGIVIEARRRFDVAEGTAVDLHLAPAAQALAIGSDYRVFQEKSPIDVIRDVLDRGGVAEHARFDLIGTYEVRPYIAQHGESDWDFVARLCAEEGIAFGFEPGDGDTVLFFTDDTTGAVDVPGGAALRVHESGVTPSSDCVFALTKRAKLAPSAVTVRGYEPSTPRVLIEGTAEEGGKSFEVYDFPVRCGTPAAAGARATRHLEAHRGERVLLRGMVAGTRLAPGFAIEIEGHPLGSLDGRYLVLSVDRQMEHAVGATEGTVHALSTTFEATPCDTPWRPAPTWGAQTLAGPETGIVVGPAGEEIHTDDGGRIRVQRRWDRLGKTNETASTWMRVGQFATGGSMIHPRIGWDVLVGYFEGDVDAPVVLGHLYDGEHPVPYALPANKTRSSWQTATTPGGGSSNEVRFEDAKGSEELFVNASFDENVVVGDCLQDAVGVDHTRTVGGNETRTIGSNEKITIGANQTFSVGGSESVTITGKRSVDVKGSETATIGGSRTQIAVGGYSLDANGGRTLTVGGSMIGATAADVSRSTLGMASVTVGGAMIQAAGTGVSGTTLGACAETVGGAKISAAGSSCSVSTKGAMAETVGGAYVITAGGNVGEAAQSALKITVGGAFVANAPSIDIVAKSKIVVRAGAASLTIKSSSVEIKAPTIQSPAGGFEKAASTIDHN